MQLVPFVVIMMTSARIHLQFLIRYAGYFIYADSRENTTFNRICSEHIDETVRSFFLKMGILYFFLLTSQSGPVYEYIKYGTRTTLTELKFPFVAEKSDNEFTGNVILQGAVGAFGGLAYVAIEIAMTLCDDVASILPKLVKYELEKFHDMFKNAKLTKAKKDSTFKVIVKHTLVADKYISILNVKNV